MLQATPAGGPTLVIASGIKLVADVRHAERVVVQGVLEATTIQAKALLIEDGGQFKGEVAVESADIAGTADGVLTVAGTLTVRRNGRIKGIARCRRLRVEEGGEIFAQIEMLSDPPAAAAPPRQLPDVAD